MIPVDFKRMVREKVVEGERLEFKRGWNPEPILHTIVAFANDIDNLGGGYILIGVEESEGMPWAMWSVSTGPRWTGSTRIC